MKIVDLASIDRPPLLKNWRYALPTFKPLYQVIILERLIL
jgi:hypothetical protein